MHSLKSIIVSFVVVFTAFAQPEGEVVIRTRDGKSRQGRVLSETQKGYLVSSEKGTSVIPFESIVDMKSVGAERAESAPPAPPSTVASAPVAPPVAREELPPPPPPALPTISESSAPEYNSALGFHFGLGVSAGGGRLGLDAGGHGVFDFNFGKTGFRIGLNLGSVVGYGVGFLGSVNGLFHVNLSGFYTLGVGAEVGAQVGEMNALFAGPVLQPVVLKFGDRRQHQFALTATVGVAFRPDQGDVMPRFGGTVGYTYLF